MSLQVESRTVWDLYFPPAAVATERADETSDTPASEAQFTHPQTCTASSESVPTNWPFIQRPRAREYWQFDSILNDEKIPNFVVSVSLYVLNYLSCLRDHVLSHTDRQMGGWIKLASVTLLATAAVIGFTLLNIAEAVGRLALAILLSPVLLVRIAAEVLDIDCLKETILDIPAIASAVFAITALYDLAITGTGIMAGYEMLTYCQDNRMRDITEIANDASFGAVDLVKSLVARKA